MDGQFPIQHLDHCRRALMCICEDCFDFPDDHVHVSLDGERGIVGSFRGQTPAPRDSVLAEATD